MIYHEGPEISSYEDCVRRFARKPRDPAAGKPLRSWARIIQDGDSFLICAVARTPIPLCRITPDNVCSFVATPTTIRARSNTLSMALHSVLPMYLWRVGTGRYKVTTYTRAGGNRHNPVEYFEGLKVDLTKAEFINPIRVETDETRRGDWLRAIRKFKRSIKARSKVGAIDGLIRKMSDEGAFRTSRTKPVWTSDQWTDKLYQAILDPQKIDAELLRGFIMTCNYGWWNQTPPDAASFIQTVDDVCNERSVALRKKFGVLKEVPICDARSAVHGQEC